MWRFLAVCCLVLGVCQAIPRNNVTVDEDKQGRFMLSRADGGVTGYKDLYGYFLNLDPKEVHYDFDNKVGCADRCDSKDWCTSFDWSPDLKECRIFKKKSWVTDYDDIFRNNTWSHNYNKDRADNHCPVGAYLDADADGGTRGGEEREGGTYRCYTIHTDPMTWQDAAEYCESRTPNDARLVTLPDSDTVRRLRRLFKENMPSEYWTGMHYSDDKDKWYWRKGSREFNWRTFAKWGYLEPADTEIKPCVYSAQEPNNASSEAWSTDDGSTQRPFVCEYRARNDRNVYPNCPEGWAFYRRHCYTMLRPSAGYTYLEAADKCSNRGDAFPLSITSASELEFVKTLMYAKLYTYDGPLPSVYTGLVRDDGGSEWRWEDGTSYSNDTVNGLINSDDGVSTCAVFEAANNLDSVFDDDPTIKTVPCTEQHAVVCKGTAIAVRNAAADDK